MQKLDGKADIPYFSYNYQKCVYVNFVTEYIGPSNYLNDWM